MENFKSKQEREAYQKQQDIAHELELQKLRDLHYLNKAGEHAKQLSDCQKVRVGSAIVDTHQRLAFGANRVIGMHSPSGYSMNNCPGLDHCQVEGHCVSTIHSEIDAIIRAKRELFGATIYVTRYPCDNCARAIVTAGIQTVVYGRKQPISEQTAIIFKASGIEVRHISSYEEEDAGERQ